MENFQPILAAKMLHLGDLQSGKCSAGKVKGTSLQPFANSVERAKGPSIQSCRHSFEEMMHVTHASPQLSQEKSKIEMDLKVSVEETFSNGVNF